MAGWATLARERADLLTERVDELESRGAPAETVRALRRKLEGVRLEHIQGPHRLAWLTGNAINESWSELHRIEERIAELSPDPAAVTADARRHAEHGLRAQDAAAAQEKLAAGQAQPRVALEVIREAHLAAEARHESERNQQRGILSIAAGLLAAAVITIIVQAVVPAGDRLVPLPANGAAMPAWAFLMLIMLFGMLGGGLSALISLYTGDRELTNTLWYDPRPALSLVKVVMGLWTGLIGVLVVSTGVVVGVYTTLASALLLAFLFGYAQQAVTRFVDRKVAALVTSAAEAGR